MCLKKILGICFSVVVWNARISWACIVVVALLRSYKPNTTAFSTFYLCYSYLFKFCFRFFYTSFHAKVVCVSFFSYCIWYTVMRNALCGTHFSFEITFYLFARLKMMVFDQKSLRSEKNHCKYEGVPPILITIYCLIFCTKFSFTMFEWW